MDEPLNNFHTAKRKGSKEDQIQRKEQAPREEENAVTFQRSCSQQQDGSCREDIAERDGQREEKQNSRRSDEHSRESLEDPRLNESKPRSEKDLEPSHESAARIEHPHEIPSFDPAFQKP